MIHGFALIFFSLHPDIYRVRGVVSTTMHSNEISSFSRLTRKLLHAARVYY